MKRLNLGILAHVDAGKTTLTERLLYATGVIDAIGSVDAGTTQTDFLALERERGITIRSAVVAFTVGDVAVNLIDTPGHPDFIAEVERALSVLDGAVLVISAVEGVQAQTVVLMRALQRLRVPTLIFVNKIDRAGADPDRVVETVRARLTRQAIPMGTASDAGRRTAAFVAYDHDNRAFLDALAETLVDHDEALLAALVTRRHEITSADLCGHLARQSVAAQVHPLYFGSAITGAGIAALVAALTMYLPAAEEDPDGPTSASVFKVERGPRGEKSAYLRMFLGTLRLRERIQLSPDRGGTVTALHVIEPGSLAAANAVSAGQIAKVSGLPDARIGDTIGTSPRQSAGAVFALPTLETAVVARDPARQSALHTALARLAEQDPLIRLRQDDLRRELFVSLYGEVQKEVIADTLAVEYGIDVEFRETAAICIERVARTGDAVERLHDPAPFLATVGLTVEPGTAGSGITFQLAVDLVTIPLYVFKTVDAFSDAMAEYVRNTLQQGLSGWQVTDAVVTMTDSDYVSPSTTAADFRKLTPLVLMTALQRAGTIVCEPIDSFQLDAPAHTLSAVLRLLTRHRAVPRAQAVDGQWCTVEGRLPAVEVQRLRQQVSGRTSGEGVLEVHFDHYGPVSGPVPTRPRSDHNPVDRKEYLLHVVRHV